ncbi:hypothetical protein GQF61_01175 [Sphingobacterium sp. DK4209]|uniref:hypothetical protein n=1 Tax=Sphingobacterium zhuxiongii TaxID=2662364 RepID=UPI0012971E66|nr:MULTISPECIES: hypothetical protein [unclassified Sphingobacterium]MVZ64448.1 hypothetical protein [Sphingobacterium sp. DK4209]
MNNKKLKNVNIQQTKIKTKRGIIAVTKTVNLSKNLRMVPVVVREIVLVAA